MRSHPKVGASWEGWVIECLLGSLALAGTPARGHFWRTHGGAEVDLVIEIEGRPVPIEVKLGPPSVSRGLVECMKDLACPHGFIVHGGKDTYPLGRGLWALSTSELRQPVRLLALLAHGAAA